jgi:hypothetical protein
VGLHRNPRCAIAVEAFMSVFEIAAKKEELLLAEWNHSHIGFHKYP